MPIISKCPKCRQPVTIPDGVDPDAEVRCPLCAVVYPLRQAMAAAPPALVPVETAETDAQRSDEGAGGPDAGQDADAPSQPAAATIENATPKIDTGQTPVDSEAFTGFRVQDEESSRRESTDDVPSCRLLPKRKKGKSAAKEIAGAILGGFLGLSLGYYLLNFFGGERFDFLEIPLPGVEHTYRHRAASDNGNAEKPETPPDTSPNIPLLQPSSRERDSQPLPADYIGLRQPPSFSSSDLGKALKVAVDLVQTDDPTAQMPLETHQELCRLAHVLTFAAGDPDAGVLPEHKRAAREILKSYVNDSKQIDWIGRLAAGLLKDEELQGGVLLAGTAGQFAYWAGMHETTVQLPGDSGSIGVLSDRPLPFAAGDTVVILGSIVHDPTENIVSYTGNQPVVVWLGMAVNAQH